MPVNNNCRALARFLCILLAGIFAYGAEMAAALEAPAPARARPAPGYDLVLPDEPDTKGPLILGHQSVLVRKPDQVANADSMLAHSTRMWREMMERNNKRPAITQEFCDMPDPSYSQWRNLRDKAPGMDPMGQLRAVNGFFNQWPSREDISLYGTLEYWASPAEFINNRSGDCEDYAIAKYFGLKALGWNPENMWLVLVTDQRGRGHAVLAVRHGGNIHFLDNLSRPKDLVMPQATYTSVYKPLVLVNEIGAWGFIKKQPPRNVARP